MLQIMSPKLYADIDSSKSFTTSYRPRNEKRSFPKNVRVRFFASVARGRCRDRRDGQRAISFLKIIFCFSCPKSESSEMDPRPSLVRVEYGRLDKR